MLAYGVETGDLRWTSPTGDHSYSSPQISTVNGKQCVLMLTNMGITFVDPADGKLLGKHDWKYEGYRVMQPFVLDGSSVLLGSGMGAGTQRIEVRWDGEQFATETSWMSRRMSPDFNDSVAHDGYLYLPLLPQASVVLNDRFLAPVNPILTLSDMCWNLSETRLADLQNPTSRAAPPDTS